MQQWQCSFPFALFSPCPGTQTCRPFAGWDKPRRCAEPAALTAAYWRNNNRGRAGRILETPPGLCGALWETNTVRHSQFQYPAPTLSTTQVLFLVQVLFARDYEPAAKKPVTSAWWRGQRCMRKYEITWTQLGAPEQRSRSSTVPTKHQHTLQELQNQHSRSVRVWCNIKIWVKVGRCVKNFGDSKVWGYVQCHVFVNGKFPHLVTPFQFKNCEKNKKKNINKASYYISPWCFTWRVTPPASSPGRPERRRQTGSRTSSSSQHSETSWQTVRRKSAC